MRRNPRSHRQPTFRGSQLPRLTTMIVMLGVLLLLIGRAGDPSTWRWLAEDDSHARSSRKDAGPANSEGGQSRAPQAAPAPPLPTGPTDQDPEEAEAIKEEFQAVTDRTLLHQPVEMEAYDRVVRWVVHQPAPLLRQRARRDLVFTQLVQAPEKYRGQLLELDLNVRRILKYDEKNRDGAQLYEVWGWTTESKAWLYVGVVVDLPEGMPSGPDVYEKARLVGYFFKLQGYHEAGAKPNAPPLVAPMLIGRLLWQPAQQPRVQDTDWLWLVLLAAGFFVIVLARWGFLFLGRKRRARALAATGGAKPGSLSIEDWFQRAEAGEAPDAGHPPENCDPSDPPASHKGHQEGRVRLPPDLLDDNPASRE